MTSTNEASEQAAAGDTRHGPAESVLEPSMMASALALAAMGLPVFPCKPRQKIPDSDHGHLDATVDVETIKRWWTETPDANIGLACDASGLSSSMSMSGMEGSRRWSRLRQSWARAVKP